MQLQRALSLVFVLASSALAETQVYGGHEYFAGDGNLDIAEMKNRLNELRSENGLGELEYDTRLECAAQYHCKAMADSGEFEHNVSGHPELPDRIANCGFEWASASENLYYDDYGGKSADAQQGLEDSQGHRDNMLGESHTRVGLAYCRSESAENYWVQVFGSELQDSGNTYLVKEDGSAPGKSPEEQKKKHSKKVSEESDEKPTEEEAPAESGSDEPDYEEPSDEPKEEPKEETYGEPEEEEEKEEPENEDEGETEDMYGKDYYDKKDKRGLRRRSVRFY